MRERSDLDHRGSWAFLPEDLVAHDAKVEPVANVGDVRRDLHDVGEVAAARLDERLDRAEHRARLAPEVAAVLHGAVHLVRHLAGEEQDRLSARHLDGLAVPGWIVDTRRTVFLDLRRHDCSPLGMIATCGAPPTLRAVPNLPTVRRAHGTPGRRSGTAGRPAR